MKWLVIFVVLSPLAFAQATADIAKNRAYPGGMDEEVLRVQASLNPPQRRLDTKTIQAQVIKNAGHVEMTEEGPSSSPSNE